MVTMLLCVGTVSTHEVVAGEVFYRTGVYNQSLATCRTDGGVTVDRGRTGRIYNGALAVLNCPHIIPCDINDGEQILETCWVE